MDSSIPLHSCRVWHQLVGQSTAIPVYWITQLLHWLLTNLAIATARTFLMALLDLQGLLVAWALPSQNTHSPVSL